MITTAIIMMMIIINVYHRCLTVINHTNDILTGEYEK